MTSTKEIQGLLTEIQAYTKQNRDTILSKALTQYLSQVKKQKNKDKGDEYEELVAQYYADQGYIVIKNGFIAQMEDKGVDLIAIRPIEVALEDTDDINSEVEVMYIYEILYIQCKNYVSQNSKIDLKQMKSIFQKLETFVENNFVLRKEYPRNYRNTFINTYNTILAIPQKENLELEAFEFIKIQAKNNRYKTKVIILEKINNQIIEIPFSNIEAYFKNLGKNNG